MGGICLPGASLKVDFDLFWEGVGIDWWGVSVRGSVSSLRGVAKVKSHHDQKKMKSARVILVFLDLYLLLLRPYL